MPTKASNRPLLKHGNHPKHRIRALNGWKSAAFGFLIAVAVVAVGRQFLAVTTSTLSGWTALFLLAVFSGLITANSVSQRNFVSPLQALAALCGTLSSLTTLFFMYRSPTGGSTTSLSIASVMLVLTMTMGFQYRTAKTATFSDKTLEHWAIRLDDLLKYDLDRETKAQLVTLIEALWHSPKDQDDFIPAQSPAFEQTLDALEHSVRCQDIVSIDRNLDNLARCLAERNELIHTAVDVSYRNLGSNTAMLPDKLSQR